MTALIGHTSLILASLLTLFQSIAPMRLAKPMMCTIATCVGLAFCCLVFAHITSDFSIINVYLNSHRLKPLIYKFSGTWGNHEGSMLLLTLILALYNMTFALYGTIEASTKKWVIRIQNVILFGFLTFIILTSNPFLTVFPTPQEGQGLNPLLQDIGLALHPPILYIGYIGLSFGLSYAVAGLLTQHVDRNWAQSLKSWIIFSWSFLTLGIGLGSWWAYRELGWGGFWFWDPVENASLMPWLSATALLHTLLITHKRETLKGWALLLGICSFSLSLIGIFLVRSGVLTSVHAFANDPSRGIYILIFFTIVTGASLIVYATKVHHIKNTGSFMPVSKETGILVNNVLLTVACGTILLGTIYPIILEVFTNQKISVGAPYFNATLAPMGILLLLASIIGPSLKWQKDQWLSLRSKHTITFLIMTFIATILIIRNQGNNLVHCLVIAACMGLIYNQIIFLKKLSIDKDIRNAIKNLLKLPTSQYAMIVAHIGFAFLLLGIAIATGWEIEQEHILHPTQSIKLNEYQLIFDKIEEFPGPNYLSRMGIFSLLDANNQLITTLNPEVRFYPVHQTTTTESSIYSTLLSDIYIAMGEGDSTEGYSIRVYYKPFINMIWIGAILICIGGFFALYKKRKNNSCA